MDDVNLHSYFPESMFCGGPTRLNGTADVTRTTTYTTDMKAYFAAIDERFKFFKPPYPTSTLIGVASLAMPEMLVEIEVEAIIETSRLRVPKGAVSR